MRPLYWGGFAKPLGALNMQRGLCQSKQGLHEAPKQRGLCKTPIRRKTRTYREDFAKPWGICTYKRTLICTFWSFLYRYGGVLWSSYTKSASQSPNTEGICTQIRTFQSFSTNMGVLHKAPTRRGFYKGPIQRKLWTYRRSSGSH